MRIKYKKPTCEILSIDMKTNILAASPTSSKTSNYFDADYSEYEF